MSRIAGYIAMDLQNRYGGWTLALEWIASPLCMSICWSVGITQVAHPLRPHHVTCRMIQNGRDTQKGVKNRHPRKSNKKSWRDQKHSGGWIQILVSSPKERPTCIFTENQFPASCYHITLAHIKDLTLKERKKSENPQSSIHRPFLHSI